MVEYKRNPNIKCIICHKSIYKRPAEIQRNKKRVFCSQICYGISCRKENPCVICKTPILAGANKKTCSKSCANKQRTGIKYKMGAPKDNVKNQRSLKLRLLEQRSNCCEKCNYDKYQILQVHHKDRDRKNNKLENLKLVCPNCHTEEHYLENSWLNNK